MPSKRKTKDKPEVVRFVIGRRYISQLGTAYKVVGRKGRGIVAESLDTNNEYRFHLSIVAGVEYARHPQLSANREVM